VFEAEISSPAQFSATQLFCSYHGATLYSMLQLMSHCLTLAGIIMKTGKYVAQFLVFAGPTSESRLRLFSDV
jgi:hypothetical protein